MGVETAIPEAVAGTPRPAPSARVGVLGIGLEAYWPQFAGLKERIEGYQRRVEQRVGHLAVRAAQPLIAARDALAHRPGLGRIRNKRGQE